MDYAILTTGSHFLVPYLCLFHISWFFVHPTNTTVYSTFVHTVPTTNVTDYLLPTYLCTYIPT